MAVTRLAVIVRFACLRYYFKARHIEYNLFQEWPAIKPLRLERGAKAKTQSLRVIIKEHDLVTGDPAYPDLIRKNLSVGL